MVLEDVPCTRGFREQGGMEQLGKALHDFCQPLTVLQCRLEMGGLRDNLESYREAVRQSLTECNRLLEAVDTMRGIFRAANGEMEHPDLRER